MNIRLFATAWIAIGVALAGCGEVTEPTEGGEVHLRVTLSGPGEGTVTSTPAGIECGAVCEATFPSGTDVALTAQA